MTRELTVATGDLATADMVLNIGPQHPATHGVLRLALTLDGERIIRADPVIGYMHRGAEKLFEARDYRQIIVLANRHDWLSSFSNELGVVLAVERMLGMEVPVRAVWARTLLAELNRTLNHLMFLGSYPIELGAITPMFYAFREREELQEVMEEISGGRMHYMFNRVGGLKEDIPAGWPDRARRVIRLVRRRIRDDIDKLVRGNEIFRARTRGVGVLAPERAQAYGVSGPIARASGVDFDLRRDEPYLAYAALPGDVLRVVTRTDGDCLARFECLLDQVYVSLDIAAHCLEDGDRLFTGVRRGDDLAAIVVRRAWTAARLEVLGENVTAPDGTTTRVVRTPTAKKVYDLRHACLTGWLNSGVPAPQVAEWAGNSVPVLLGTYAKCIGCGSR